MCHERVGSPLWDRNALEAGHHLLATSPTRLLNMQFWQVFSLFTIMYQNVENLTLSPLHSYYHIQHIFTVIVCFTLKNLCKDIHLRFATVSISNTMPGMFRSETLNTYCPFLKSTQYILYMQLTWGQQLQCGHQPPGVTKNTKIFMWLTLTLH